MKRVEIIYGGHLFTVADTDPAAIEAQISDALHTGTPLWLTVNQGEGSLRESRILITAGVSVSLTGIDPNKENPAPEE